MEDINVLYCYKSIDAKEFIPNYVIKPINAGLKSRGIKKEVKARFVPLEETVLEAHSQPHIIIVHQPGTIEAAFRLFREIEKVSPHSAVYLESSSFRADKGRLRKTKTFDDYIPEALTNPYCLIDLLIENKLVPEDFEAD